MQKLLISIMFCATLVAGCSVHKLEIQQGNIITDDMLAQLKTGMSTKQVKFLLGSPQLLDPFHKNRWDYIYSLRENGKRTAYKHLILYFEDDTLSKIEQRNGDNSNG